MHPVRCLIFLSLVFTPILLSLTSSIQAEIPDSDFEEDAGDSAVTLELSDLAELGRKDKEHENPGEAKYWEAMMLLDRPQDPDFDRGRELLLEAANLDFTPAQNQVGICYLTGNYGFRKSERRAADWFQLAAEEGDAYAMANLGRCYIYGTGVWKNRRKAKTWLLKVMEAEAQFPVTIGPDEYFAMISSDKEEQEVNLYATEEEISSEYQAQLNASTMLARIFAEEEDQENTFKYAYFASGFDKRSTKGDYWSAATSALSLAFGMGVEKDRDKAVEILEFTKKLVHKQAMGLAHSLSQKKVIDELAMGDLESAFKEAAQEQTSQIEYNIATIFSNEDSKDWDPAEAVPWFELAAENGRAWAMLKLGFLYHEAESAIHDPEKSFFWFKQAAEEGNHLLGYLNLGICYFHGLGTEVDHQAARAAWEKGRDSQYGCYISLSGSPPDRVLTYSEELQLHKDATRGRDADPHAQYIYGYRNWHGYGMEVDYGKAYSYFKKASRGGHAEATFYMGMDYYNGLYHERDYQKALELLKEADSMNSRFAPFRLGYIYDLGIGVAEDNTTAIRYYQKDLELGVEVESSLNNLGVILMEQLSRKGTGETAETVREQMLGYFQKASDKGSSKAAYNLGKLYLSGELVPQDYRKAYFHFRDAAERGDSNANYYLGKIHDEGLGMAKTPAEAAYHFRLAAINDSTSEKFRKHAFNRLVFYYRYGVGLPRDLERALHWSTLHSGQLSALAFKRRGDLLLELGRYDEALDYFKAMVQVDHSFLKGHAYARLSQIYTEGLGVDPNPRKATKYFDKAIKLHSSLAYFMLGMEYTTANRLAEAASAFALAARSSSFEDESSSSCQVTVGGQTLELREDLASELPESLYRLGCLYYTGKGLPLDQETAWKLFHMAANLGCSEAQLNIGVATLKGNPNAPSLERAVELVQMAANLGYPKADLVLSKLLELLDQQRQEDEGKPKDGDTSSSWWMETA